MKTISLVFLCLICIQLAVGKRLFNIPEATALPYNDRKIYQKVVESSASSSRDGTSVLLNSASSSCTPTSTEFQVYDSFTSITFFVDPVTTTVSVDANFLTIVLFEMMSANSTYFDDDYIKSLDSDQFSDLSSSISNYNNLHFPDSILKSSLATKYASLFAKIPEITQSLLYDTLTNSYVELAAIQTQGSWYFAGVGLYNFSTSSSYDVNVPASTATGITSVYSDLYILAQCVGFDYEINLAYGHEYNTFYSANSNNNQLNSFLTVYSDWKSAESGSSNSLTFCSSMVKFVEIFPWSERMIAEAKIALKYRTKDFTEVSIIPNATTFSPPLTLTGFDDFTSVTFSVNNIGITNTVDQDFLKVVLFRMMTASSSYFNDGYLNSLDNINYSMLSSSLSDFKLSPFPDQLIETSLAQGYASMFSKIPSSELITLITEVSNYYTGQDAQRTEGSWYFAQKNLYNFTTVTSYDTYLPESTASGNYKVFSDLFVLAQCVGFDYEVHNYGHEYNEFATASTNTNTTAFSEFQSLYSVWITNLNANLSTSLELCTSLERYFDMLPWSDRIKAEGKIAFEKQTSLLYTTLVVGGTTFSMPPAPSTASITQTVQVTGEYTHSTVFPFEVVYEASLSNSTGSSTYTHTTTVSHSEVLTTTGTITNTINTKQIITSKNAEFILCGAEAIIYRYMNSSEIYEYLSNNKHNSVVQSYTSLLQRYKNKNIMTDSAELNEVMVSFYNLIFALPDEIKQNLIDVLGYCYLRRATAGGVNFHVKDYTSSEGVGKLFSSIFKFGSGSTFYDYMSVYTEYNIDSNSLLASTFPSTYMYTTKVADSYAPLIIRTQMNGTGDDVADLNLIAQSAIRLI